MLRTTTLALLCGCVLLFEGSASGQDDPKIDCEEPLTQFDINVCSQEDFDAADAELNEVWKFTKQAEAEQDSRLPDELKGAEEALVSAQRAWIAFRDTQCKLVGFEARGGSMEPMLVSGCMALMTRKRSEELRDIANGSGD